MTAEHAEFEYDDAAYVLGGLDEPRRVAFEIDRCSETLRTTGRFLKCLPRPVATRPPLFSITRNLSLMLDSLRGTRILY